MPCLVGAQARVGREVTETVTEQVFVMGEYVRVGETAVEALTRLSASLAGVNLVFDLLGTTLLDGSLSAADWASKLVDAIGSMDALTEALLMFAARRDHVNHLIAPALARGDVVLCDRFADASFAYQGGGRQLDWQTLQTIEQMVLRQPEANTAVLQPDLTLWFDLPPATAAQRMAGTRDLDRFEAESTAFFDRVSAAYARRAAENPGRFVRVDAAAPPGAVWRQVQAAVAQKGWLQTASQT